MHVVDDDAEVCWAVAAQLMSAGIAVETYGSGFALLEALPAALDTGSIGCVLTDLRMPGMDGLELLTRLSGCGLRRPVVVMTAYGDISIAVQAMKAGAFDFLEKPFDDESLLSVIGAALGASGSTGTPVAASDPEPVAGRGAAGAHPRATEAAARIAALPPREREVLALLMAGKSSKAAARELGLSPRTVESHRAQLMLRLGAGSLAEAVRLAVWAELASPDQAAAPPPDQAFKAR